MKPSIDEMDQCAQAIRTEMMRLNNWACQNGWVKLFAAVGLLVKAASMIEREARHVEDKT